jgi:hypothetical protein
MKFKPDILNSNSFGNNLFHYNSEIAERERAEIWEMSRDFIVSSLKLTIPLLCSSTLKINKALNPVQKLING